MHAIGREGVKADLRKLYNAIPSYTKALLSHARLQCKLQCSACSSKIRTQSTSEAGEVVTDKENPVCSGTSKSARSRVFVARLGFPLHNSI